MENLIHRLKKAANKKKAFKFYFIIVGILSTLWFLIRVIPKPSRATYPCMRAAAPIMSSFIIYLLSLSGSVMAFKIFGQKIKKLQFYSAIVFFAIGLGLGIVLFIHQSNINKAKAAVIDPSDGPNQPFGEAQGIFPGRVVWVWDTTMTKKTFASNTYFFYLQNNNVATYHKVMREAILKLTEKKDLKSAWDTLFRYFNKQKTGTASPYVNGQIIFLKVNQGTISWTCSENTGWDFTKSMNKESAAAWQGNPFTMLAILTQLIDSVGIPQENIFVGDPITHIMKQIYDILAAKYPNVKYADKSQTSVNKYGRTLITPSDKVAIYYSDKGTVMTGAVTEKIYTQMEEADYLINLAAIKGHVRAGITLCAKNHFGSNTVGSAWHLHPSLVSPDDTEQPTANQYKKYRVFVDIMGSKYLGRNTMLFIVDGSYGGDYHELYPPRKWKMYPFNNNWCNSLFMSQDQVALESVCFDFLRTEYNGVNNSHTNPNWGAVDDYLHQAASSSEWPDGITYDPDNSGTPLPSLGVHEHWNNATDMEYSRNLGTGNGIELVKILNTVDTTSKPDIIRNIPSLADDIKLYPNPAINNAWLSFNLKTMSDVHIYIIDFEGRIIKNITDVRLKNGLQNIQLTINDLKPGNYICVIKSSNSVYTSIQSVKLFKR